MQYFEAWDTASGKAIKKVRVVRSCRLERALHIEPLNTKVMEEG